MAETATKRSGWEKRSKAVVKPHKKFRVLTAASTEIDVGDNVQAQRQRMLRQNWQLQAWMLFNSIPEVAYADGFLAHCSGRMRIFPAAYPVTGETDNPLKIDDPLLAAPPEVIEACTNALNDLGNGRLAIKNIMETLSLNLSVTGEAFLLGIVDQMTQQQVWSIRSVSEIVIYDDQIKLREGPMTNTGVLGLVDLPPDTMVERMWQPHPQFRLLAQSPMRALVQSCEDLMIMRRLIRATGRSRLAGRGILFLPSEMDVPSLNDDQSSEDSDDFLSKLTTAMMTPIKNEGDASGVVPLVVQAPGEQIDHIKWIEFSSTFDAQASAIRQELIGVIATGKDLPKEVIMGMTDLNHWSAWQVDSNTFRHHIEPHVISEVECLTGAFLRPYFATCGLEKDVIDEWLQRILFWYDPTELVTPPDLSASAITAYGLRVISGASLRKYLGFKDSDAPDAEEIEIRLVSDTKTWPVNALMALLHELDPTLEIPAVAGPPALPGIKPATVLDPGGVELPPAPIVPTAATAPIVTTTDSSVVAPSPTNPLPGSPDDSITSSGLPESERQMMIRVFMTELVNRLGYNPWVARIEPIALVAATTQKKPNAKELRLSRKLVSIDMDLRSKLVVAANAEMKRQLEKAGVRTRQTVAKNATLRKKIAKTKNEYVLLKLSGDIDQITAASYVTNDWSSLEEQFKSWTALAQRQAVGVAAQLAGIPEEDAYAKAAVALSEGVEKGWGVLRDSMNELAQHLAYNPDPNLTDDAVLDALNPNTLVPTGVLRTAVGLAGGSPLEAFKNVLLDTGATVPAVPNTVAVGGVATGATIGNILTSAGAQTSDYEWVHGPSDKPFDGHEELDGVEFSSFTDPALANPGDWPPVEYFLPGDHAGCLCDVTALWISPTSDDSDGE